MICSEAVNHCVDVYMGPYGTDRNHTQYGSPTRWSPVFCMFCGLTRLAALSLGGMRVFTGDWAVVVVVMCDCIHLFVCFWHWQREREREWAWESLLSVDRTYASQFKIGSLVPVCILTCAWRERINNETDTRKWDWIILTMWVTVFPPTLSPLRLKWTA